MCSATAHTVARASAMCQRTAQRLSIYIPQRGVQWKQGVVICMLLHTSLLYNTTPIRCIILRLHPPLMNTQSTRLRGGRELGARPVFQSSIWKNGPSPWEI